MTKVRIDFQLNGRFSVLEKLIFRLVLNGFTNASEIAASLFIFSDHVIAKAIRNLVNNQMLKVDMISGNLHISEGIVLIINVCLSKQYDVDIPDYLDDQLTAGIPISSFLKKSKKDTVSENILRSILPGVDLSLYGPMLDFVVYRG